MKSNHSPLVLNRRTIRQNARKRFSGNSIAVLALRQVFYENWLKVSKQVNFRSRENSQARLAYRAMTPKEFEGINARQYWANWRTIPYNLDTRIPQRPLKVVDLCCGVGHSTEVLAYYLPCGSEILGLEYNPEFVSMARERIYRGADGTPCHVTFHAQSVLETFCTAEGYPLPDRSIDLVNSCGAVGAHFTPVATKELATEVARVLVANGHAMIDSGPEGTRPEEVIRIFETLGFETLHSTKSCFLDRFTQICFRRSS